MRRIRHTRDSAANEVSIHASVKDATKLLVMEGGLPPVSIHASVKDATSSGDGY